MDIVKIKADLNLVENRKQYRSINEERKSWFPLTLLVGMQTSTATMENSVEIS